MSILNKIEHIFSAVLATLAMTATLTGCVDDLIDESVEIPDAAVEIRGEVIYRPLVSTNIQTRAGDAPEGAKYTNINSLYVFFFDKDRQLVGDYCGEVTFNASKPENSDKRVTFNKRVKAGQYYVYAVVNVPKDELEKVNTIEELKNFKLTWDNDISKDLEMFGVFKNDSKESPSTPKNDSFEEDALITITPQQKNLHSWVRRALSKVTVDFDGTNLKEGVTVYIKNAVLKNVASATLLGSPSKIGDDGIEIGTTDYFLTYGNGESHESWQSVVTKGKKFSPKEIWQDSGIEDFHDDNARALPCYENMQGEPEGKSKLQDKNGDGKIDSEVCDGVVNGTYLEVEGYYVSNRSEYKSEGKIIYRFMLGKDAENNFDVVRNHHYKITMMFKGYGNDVDWHIEYSEKYLDVTYPEDVNYQGKFFVPDADISGGTDYLANGGHTFNDQNVITVTSYETDGTNNTWVTPDITYTYYSYNEQTGNWDKDDSGGKWLTETEGALSEDKTQRKYTFVASMSNPTSRTVNSLFPTTSVGSEASPYNLSNNKGESKVENTANCYMVGSPGWYSIPLVYGNAITNGQTNGDAYASTNIVNHLKNKISTPYITDNTGVTLSNVSVKLIWQDAQNLIIPSSIQYDASLFNGKGGIKFHISQIQEGNAVIALIDNNANEDEYVDIDRKIYGKHGSTKAVWSWHIWATRFGFDDFGKDIRILNHDEKAFDVMPVNLGWCSGDKEIRYYKRRKCEITFKVGEQEITREIEQYPHLVLPRGDHPYYQWGRKDPFVGTNTAFGNKERWTTDAPQNCGTGSEYNPPRLYQEPEEFQDNAGRHHTKDCLDVLVKNPDKWHNAPRMPDPTNPPYKSINESFSDLWSNNGKKTVYDPCPPGYQVGDKNIFTGFTSTGGNAMYPKNWYDVLESNMEPGYYSDVSINGQVIEFYTDTRKLQSIAFPVTGYRDYDSKAEVMQYPNGGANGQGFAWTNTAKDQTNSYHLKIERKDITSDWQNRGTIIAPLEGFYNTDGFGVRPVATSSMK